VFHDRRAAPDGARGNGADGPVRVRLRERLAEGSMLILTGVVVLLLFVYLFAALLRPEWF
jgi:K+-transporting ATPase KdpF subunit